MTYNISVKGVLNDCENNEALYVAARLEDNGYNITEMLDLDQYGFYDKLDELKNMTFDIDDVSDVANCDRMKVSEVRMSMNNLCAMTSGKYLLSS